MSKEGGIPRSLRVLVDWAPFIIVYIVFESLRSFVPRIVFRVDDRTPLLFEEKIFGAPLSLVMYHYRSLIAEYASSIIYAMHPLDAVLMALILYFQRRKSYYRYVSSFTAISIMGLLLYFVWPVAPPWMVLPGTRIPNYLARFVSLLKGSVYGDPNPFAAMPSLHMALAFLVAYYMYKAYDSAWIRGLAFAWPSAMLFSIIYTGNHYLLDAIVGLAIGVAGIRVGEVFSPRLEAGMRYMKMRSSMPMGLAERRIINYVLRSLHSYSSMDLGRAESLVFSLRGGKAGITRRR